MKRYAPLLLPLLKGDWVYISGSIVGVNCTLSPIAIHPAE